MFEKAFLWYETDQRPSCVRDLLDDVFAILGIVRKQHEGEIVA